MLFRSFPSHDTSAIKEKQKDLPNTLTPEQRQDEIRKLTMEIYNEFDHTCLGSGEEFEVYVEYEPSLSASKIEYILCPICGELKRDVTLKIPYVSEHKEICEECYIKLSYEEFIKNKGE